MKDTAKIKYRSPLIDWGMTESDALAYCYSRGLDWEGLYKERTRLSCWCCPLQRINDLRLLYRDFPELWQQLKEMDARQHRTLKSDNRTVEYFEKRFQQENAKNNQEATDE
jgi:hypothetical protein